MAGQPLRSSSSVKIRVQAIGTKTIRHTIKTSLEELLFQISSLNPITYALIRSQYIYQQESANVELTNTNYVMAVDKGFAGIVSPLTNRSEVASCYNGPWKAVLIYRMKEHW